MAKDDSLFSSLDTTIENKIYVANDFALDIVGHGDVTCRRGQVVNVFHVPSLSVNLLSVSQLTYTDKIVEFWPDHFFIKDRKNPRPIIAKGVLDPKDKLYKFCDLSRLESRPTSATDFGMKHTDI